MALKKFCISFFVVSFFSFFHNLHAAAKEGTDFEDTHISSRQMSARKLEEIQPIHKAFLPLTTQIKTLCAQKKEEDFLLMMRAHFHQLKLMNAKGEWAPRLREQNTRALLPENLSMEDIHTFIDEIAMLTSQNPIFVEFAEKLLERDLHDLWTENIIEEASNVIPDAIAYTMVQNNITRAQVEDIRFLEACNDIWREALHDVFIPKHFSLFETAKFYTIRGLSGLIRINYLGYIRPSYGNFYLPFNIGEAAASDFFMGNFQNAYSGYTLMKNPPGVPENPRTGEGASEFTPLRGFPHGGMLSLRPPFPKAWNNLYSAWNLAFVSTFKEFPYFVSKLINPQVLNYQAHPEHYMYKRVLALHTHAHWLLFRRINETRGMIPPMDWRSRTVTGIFGGITRTHAIHYQNRVTQVRDLPEG